MGIKRQWTVNNSEQLCIKAKPSFLVASFIIPQKLLKEKKTIIESESKENKRESA